MLDDATLIASELVTNAVIHSGCATREVIEVRVWKRSRRIMISVRDPGSSGKQAVVTEGDLAGYGGFGLKVVEAVALAWGAERVDGYRVWAELALGDDAPCLTSV